MNTRFTKKCSNMKGGKFIAQGTYGCVFGKPRLICSDEAVSEGNDGYVSKLMDNDEAKTEIEENRVIDELDPEYKFHLKTERMCVPSTAQSLVNMNDLKKCNVQMRDQRLISMEDGGRDLGVILKTLKDEGRDLYTLIKTLSTFTNVMEGLDSLRRNNYGHFDIKENNIVYKFDKDTRTNRFNVIDFGNAKTFINEYNDSEYSFRNAGYLYALDSMLVNFINKDNMTKEEFMARCYQLQNYYSTNASRYNLHTYHNSFTRFISPEFMIDVIVPVQAPDGGVFTTEITLNNLFYKFVDYFDDYYELYTSPDISGNAQKFGEKIISYFDSFSVGLIFIKMLYVFTELRYSGSFHDMIASIDMEMIPKVNIEFLTRIYNVITLLTSPTIKNRIYLDEAIEMLFGSEESAEPTTSGIIEEETV